MHFPHVEGLVAAPFTPLNPDGSLNLEVIPSYCHMLKANDLTGAFICGSTGEGVSLSLDEKKRVIEAWGKLDIDTASFKIFALVGGTSLADSIDLARYARDCGLYAVSFTSPFYFKPASVETLAEICMEVGAAVPDMPFYYYHIPVLTGVGYPMYELLKSLDGRMPNFAGIKYTHEDFMDFLSCLHFANGQFDMLWGRDENMLAALALGAKGAVGSTFNYAAPLYYEMIRAFNDSDLVSARRLQQQSIDMIRLLGKYGGIATGKAYMKRIGMDCGGFSLPVKNMSAIEWEAFNADLDELGFDNFRSRVI